MISERSGDMQDKQINVFSQVLDIPIIQEKLSLLVSKTEKMVQKCMQNNEVFYPLTASQLTNEEINALNASGLDVDISSSRKISAFLYDYALKIVESKPEYSEYLKWSSLERQKSKLEFEISRLNEAMQEYAHLNEKLEALNSQLTQVNENLANSTYLSASEEKNTGHVR